MYYCKVLHGIFKGFLNERNHKFPLVTDMVFVWCVWWFYGGPSPLMFGTEEQVNKYIALNHLQSVTIHQQ